MKSNRSIYILGLETSCDETAAAVIRDGQLLADSTTTQIIHSQYGGVVPEVASRAHEKLMALAVREVLSRSGIKPSHLAAVAVTHGPGLAGALLVGVSFAKGLALGLNIPLIGVNHIEAHLWSVSLIQEQIPTPFLALIISGGHTLLIHVRGFGSYRVLGGTRDDAAGELFDKAGRMLGFPFPSGAEIDQRALDYDGEEISFPRARLKNDPFSFSFSGLKTAVLYHLKGQNPTSEKGFLIPEDQKSAISKGIMSSVGEMLVKSLLRALDDDCYQAVVVAGGVSASRFLRQKLEEAVTSRGLPLFIPAPELCTDNGAMIANIGFRKFNLNQFDTLDLQIDPGLKLKVNHS